MTRKHFDTWNTEDFFRTATLDDVKRHLDGGASIHAHKEHGKTSLHLAAEWSEIPTIIAELLIRGAEINARNKYGRTPLHYAAKLNKCLEITKVLLASKAKVDPRDKDGFTPLHYAAGWSKTPEIVNTLLQAGADPKAKNDAGKTAWDLAKQNIALSGTQIYWELHDLQY